MAEALPHGLLGVLSKFVLDIGCNTLSFLVDSGHDLDACGKNPVRQHIRDQVEGDRYLPVRCQ